MFAFLVVQPLNDICCLSKRAHLGQFAMYSYVQRTLHLPLYRFSHLRWRLTWSCSWREYCWVCHRRLPRNLPVNCIRNISFKSFIDICTLQWAWTLPNFLHKITASLFWPKYNNYENYLLLPPLIPRYHAILPQFVSFFSPPYSFRFSFILPLPISFTTLTLYFLFIVFLPRM